MRFFRRKKVDIPSIDDPIWEDLVTKNKKIILGTLGAKVLLMRQQVKIINSENTDIKRESAIEFRNYFVRNANLPKVKKDLNAIIALSEGN